MAEVTPTQPDARIVNCLECAQPHQLIEIKDNQWAECTRCGNELYRQMPKAIDQAIALYITALLLFIVANIFPLLNLSLSGRLEQSLVVSSSLVFFNDNMALLGILVLLTSMIFPLLVILGNLYLLIPIRVGTEPPYIGQIFRMIQALSPWSLGGVYMLGLLISIVKLQDLATVLPGYALIAFTLFVIVYTAARTSYHLHDIWQLSDHQQPTHEEFQQHTDWLQCHSCHLLNADKGQNHCVRCADSLHHRKHASVQSCWALLIAACVMIIPANTYPVMSVIKLGKGEPSTILSGVVHLIEGGMWGLALIVFIASIVVPVCKLGILAYLLISVKKGSSLRQKERTRLYRLTETVGAWSMVDVFLVGILSAIVSIEGLATIEPGPGATFFAAVVIITMFAAYSFDPRLIWDNTSDKEPVENGNT